MSPETFSFLNTQASLSLANRKWINSCGVSLLWSCFLGLGCPRGVLAYYFEGWVKTPSLPPEISVNNNNSEACMPLALAQNIPIS